MRPEDFLATANLLPEPMLLVAPDGEIQGANRAFFSSVIDAQTQEVVGSKLSSVLADAPARIDEYLRSCVRSGQMVLGAVTVKRGEKQFDYRCEGVACRTGTERRTQCILLRLRSKSEGNSAFVTLSDQINQLNAQMARREQVEDALRRQSETLEVTLRSIGDAVIVTDAKGLITFLNTVAQQLTGWEAAEALQRPLHEVFRILNEYTRQPVENPVTRVLETGGIIGLANHTVLLNREGREFPIDDSAAPIRLPSGDLFGVVLIFRDITEQKRAEHARAWLAAIIESSDDAIVSKTLDGTITSWNRGAERVFGYRADEAIGKPITIIVPPELLDEERSFLARVHAGKPVEHFDTVRLAKDGRRLDISLTVSPIRDVHGTIVGASKVARDITERKQAEHALRDANRRKDEFLATLAHELRNPLAPIRHATELLARMPLDQAAHSSTQIIGRQVRQLTSLVDDLLDVSRITAGRVRLHKEPLDLAALVGLAIEACRPLVDAAQHTLTLQVPPQALFVQGDRVRLPQVFSNILNNAAKYTPPGGRIEVAIERSANEAVVRIRDSGIGIPPSMLNYVFELFAQVDRSYDRTGAGLGLGLSVTKRLVEMHGGRIEAHSEGTDNGSEFVVRLPAADDAPLPEPQPAPHSANSIRRRVLIADDNQDAAISLGMLLQMMGHETRVVHDGLAALQAAEDMKPDVVILDIGMPHLDGYATVQRLAQRPWTENTLFVALTGWGQEHDRKRAMEAGFDHHLVKPVDPEVLEALLARIRSDP